MGMMGVFKWLRKDIVHRDRRTRSLSTNNYILNNDSYCNALQAFIERRRLSDNAIVESTIPNVKDKFYVPPSDPNNDNDNKDTESKIDCKSQDTNTPIPGVPLAQASEIFEIGWVPGTEDRYLELIFAEWQTTRISLKRHTHPDCWNAIKEDLKVLTEIRHPNVLLLMAVTRTDDHGLVSIFEAVECTLYNYMHEQGERISIQAIAKCGGKLADALKHAHMRGYTHGAISPHCVYLGVSGTIKLGGWELATHDEDPKDKQKYEKLLRTEIYRWQAPELFHGYKPLKETDVYGLTLLIWEMCTKQIPWSGCDITEVEKQYVYWKQGVITDTYNFPPLLNNLLKAGLQLDVAKRNLDMNRMRRCLQRLEMQYENDTISYVTSSTENNNESIKIVPIAKPNGVSKDLNTEIIEMTNAPKKQSHDIIDNGTVAPSQNISDSRSDKINLCDNIDENKPRPANTKETNHLCIAEKSNCEKDDASSSWIKESIDNEFIATNARSNIKRLKEKLANQRNKFFGKNDPSLLSLSDTSSKTENKILTEVRSKDYEPHKPASHKTSLAPRHNKYFGEYDSSYVAPIYQRYNRKPYAHTPAQIKEAVVPPRILNADPQSFFESSLWRKEKLICISKMRRSNDEQSCSTTDKTEDIYTKVASTKCTDTYTTDKCSVADDTTEVRQEDYTRHSESANNSMNDYNTENNKSLQILKDALDRATEIICSTSPQIEKRFPSSNYEPIEDLPATASTAQSPESSFEMINNMKSNFGNGGRMKVDIFSSNTTRTNSRKVTDNGNIENDFTDPKQPVFRAMSAKTSHESTTSAKHKNDNGLFHRSSNLNNNESLELKASNISETNPVDSSFCSMLSKSNDCESCCYMRNLMRRHSLPTALCRLRTVNNSSVGKLPIHRFDLTGDTSGEDFYIDDDLGMMNLNVNMILSDEDILFNNLLFDT